MIEEQYPLLYGYNDVVSNEEHKKWNVVKFKRRHFRLRTKGGPKNKKGP